MDKNNKYKVLSGILAATMLSSQFTGIAALAENTATSISEGAIENEAVEKTAESETDLQEAEPAQDEVSADEENVDIVDG